MPHRDPDRLSQIERITAELIGQSGYYATSLQSIADRVGITKAGLLHYVGSKDNLLTMVMDEYDAEGMAMLSAGDIPAPDDAEQADTDCGVSAPATAESEATPETTPETSNVEDFTAIATGIMADDQDESGIWSVPKYFRRLAHVNARRPEFVRLFTMLNTETLNPEHPAREYFRTREKNLERAAHDPRWEFPDGVDGPAAIMTAFMAMDGIQIKWLREPGRDLEAMWRQMEPALFPPSIWGTIDDDTDDAEQDADGGEQPADNES